MDNFKINRKDLFFILKEQLNYSSLCSLDRYKDIDEKMMDMVVTEAISVATGIVDPLQEIGEESPPRLEDGKVICPPEFREAFKHFGEDGWVAISRDLEYGGQGFPRVVGSVVSDLMYGACQGYNMAPSLTHGAAHLIENFGKEEYKKLYVPRMYGGEWAGTMCLTEPDSGSDLSGTVTTAYREGDHFKIKGTKIFISWGDHDLADNIIHLLLARIEGAPEGTRGISLFIVPKIRVNPDGTLGEPNDVICERIEEKLGIHSSPTAELSFGSHDNCIGYLCGEENMGLACMFQMMNSARINTGLSGMTICSTAYQNALAYTKERLQGSHLLRPKEGKVRIIEHPDIRRMLLWMKANVDGMRSMIYTGAYWLDLASESPEPEKKAYYNGLVEFYTPIIKAYCSDMGFRVCETAIQCLGGYGFTREYPLEQYLRDIKILSLYEGTNGIQSIDLMGRKMRINEGALFKAFLSEVGGFIKDNISNPVVGHHIKMLGDTLEKLKNVAMSMAKQSKEDTLQWASNTYPALLCFGDVTMAWRLLDMAIIAQKKIDEQGENPFYFGKILQATYFTETTLPLTIARLETCMRTGREIVEIPEEAF